LNDTFFFSAPQLKRDPLGSLVTSMNDQTSQGRRWIGDILRRNWDPIGANTRPDEFATHVAEVERLIGAHVRPRELAEYLVRVETERLGYQDTDPKMLVPLAKKLLRLNVTSGGGEPAA